jgi:hypothetical protein
MEKKIRETYSQRDGGMDGWMNGKHTLGRTGRRRKDIMKLYNKLSI